MANKPRRDERPKSAIRDDGAGGGKYQHQCTFDAVMAALTRSLTSDTPNTCADITADLERLLIRLDEYGILDRSAARAKELENLALLKRDAWAAAWGKDKPANRSSLEEPFFDLLKACLRESNDELIGKLDRLYKDRGVFQHFIYTRLGIYRSNFFVSIYGDFTLCHEHPFLPTTKMVIGPRFHQKENEKLQRQAYLTPFSERKKKEAPIVRQLNESVDLSVRRALEWFESPENLTEWERSEGDIVFFSEGAYYAFALERAYRYGLPDDLRTARSQDVRGDIERCATLLRLIRREDTTKRWDIVADWIEAAFYKHALTILTQRDTAQAAYKRVEAIARAVNVRVAEAKATWADNLSEPDDPSEWKVLEKRIEMVTKLPDWHPVARCAAQFIDSETDIPALLLELAMLRGRRDGAAKDVLQVLSGLMKLIDEERPSNAAEFGREIRPVIDVDVFSSGDFNAVLLPLALRHESNLLPDRAASAGAIELRGVAFISTQVDLLEDYFGNRSKLNEIRAIFTLLGHYNLKVALETELLRCERIRHIASLIHIYNGAWKDFASETQPHRFFRELRHDIGNRLEDLISDVQPEHLRQRLRVVCEYVAGHRSIPGRLVRDLQLYSAIGVVSRSSVERHSVSALVRTAWEERVEPELRMRRLPVPFLEMNTEFKDLYVRGDREALEHAFENVLLNAAEAVVPLNDKGRIRVYASSAATGGFQGISLRREVILTVEDNGPQGPEDTRSWFEPGFSTKEAGWNYGFGLASAWKSMTRHRGRIWAERSNDERTGAVTRLRLVLPLDEPTAAEDASIALANRETILV